MQCSTNPSTLFVVANVDVAYVVIVLLVAAYIVAYISLVKQYSTTQVFQMTS